MGRTSYWRPTERGSVHPLCLVSFIHIDILFVQIEIEVNGQPVDNRMMLTESGSAYFVKPKLNSFDNDAEPNVSKLLNKY